MKTFFIVILILALMGLGLWLLAPNFFFSSSAANKTEPVACTLDAKACPDGSYVGRVPPSCNFAPCPGQ